MLSYAPPVPSNSFFTSPAYAPNRMALVASYENRGSQTWPFGYVYFVDGTRVVFTRQHEGETPVAVGDKGALIDPRILSIAEEFLSKHFG